MNKTIALILKISVPVILVVDIILVILFLQEFLNYCSSFDEMMKEIEEELGLGQHEGEDKSALRPFEEVFCQRNIYVSTARSFGHFIVLILNIVFLVSLFIAFILSVFSIFQRLKCYLICTILFSLCPDVLAFIDLIIGLSQDDTLKAYGTISDGLIKKVDEALILVKQKKNNLILYSIFPLVFSILIAIVTGILICLFNKEEQNKQMEQFYKLTNNQNNMQQNLTQLNYNNNNNYDNNNTPVVQENLVQPNNN